MWKPLTLGLTAVFWTVMMALLWRAEFGSGKPLGATVPAPLVFSKILTAPDSSTLEIRNGTNRIGYCRWRPDVGQELATGARMEENDDPVEGMVRQLAYYTLDVDGNVAIPDLPQRARFMFSVKLDTNRVWQEFMLRVTVRPDVYEISAKTSEQMLRVHVDAGADQLDRKIPFADLQDPRRLLTELGGPALPLMLGIVGAPAGTNASGAGLLRSFGIKWQAHNDALMLGRNNVRAYRLNATLLERYKATFYVSPVGELLRVELPNKIVLVNDALSPLQRSHD
jgi:hypothetical protein